MTEIRHNHSHQSQVPAAVGHIYEVPEATTLAWERVLAQIDALGPIDHRKRTQATEYAVRQVPDREDGAFAQEFGWWFVWHLAAGGHLDIPEAYEQWRLLTAESWLE